MGRDEMAMAQSSCVIQVGYELTINEENMPDVSSARIFRVPRLRRDSKDRLHSPHLVSIGPFQYGKKELQGMENPKSEAVRRMQKRIHRSNPHPSIKSIVEEFILLKDNKIRKFYGEHIPVTSIELAWMDLLKFQTGSAESAKQKVEHLMSMLLWRATRHEAFMWKARVSYNMYCKNHVLEVVYRSMVGSDVEEFLDSPPSSRNRMQICLEKCFGSMKAISRRWYDLCFLNSSSNKSLGNAVDMVYLKLPTAMELVRGGVKIQPVLFEDIKRAVPQDPTRSMDCCSAIRWIRFDEKTSTLYLPQFRVTLEVQILIGSIIAMDSVQYKANDSACVAY
ncbi:hypothetical protein SUGI_1174370 [Cryptomeria japonica]|nr:hypothetical protein SUGI_1174370 [Cryptomeria japonica]